MAVPVIREANTSQFIKSRGQILGQAVEKVGSIASTAVEKVGEERKANKAKTTLIDGVIEAEEEHYMKTHSLYGKPVQEGSAEFKEMKRRSERLRGKLKGMEPERIQDYKFGRGSWLQKTSNFNKKHGIGGMQWVEPTIEGYIRDPSAKEIDEQIKAYGEKEKLDFFTGWMETTLSDPKNKDMTREEAMSLLINDGGVPDIDVDENGHSFPDNLDEGREKGKILQFIGTAEGNRLFTHAFQSAESKLAKQKEADKKAKEKNEANKNIGPDGEPIATDSANRLAETKDENLIKHATKLHTSVKIERNKAQASFDKLLKDKDHKNSAAVRKYKESSDDPGLRTDDGGIFDQAKEQIRIKDEKLQIFNAAQTLIDQGKLPSIKWTDIKLKELVSQIFDEEPDSPNSMAGILKAKFNPDSDEEIEDLPVIPVEKAGVNPTAEEVSNKVDQDIIAGTKNFRGNKSAPQPRETQKNFEVDENGRAKVKTEEEALALPPGTRFILPDGRTGTST